MIAAIAETERRAKISAALKGRPKPVRYDLTGQRFGRYLAVAHVGRSLWQVRCDCGTAHLVDSALLRRGLAKSCGC